jgi:hypothetical protein
MACPLVIPWQQILDCNSQMCFHTVEFNHVQKTINAMKNPISASDVYFIKLGSGGGWEAECIHQGTIKVGFVESDHRACKNGKWERVKAFYLRQGKTKGKATEFTNQLKRFYESDSKALWITFSDNRLWWCNANKAVKRLSDGNKIRRVIGRWSDKDIHGNRLNIDGLDGRLSMVRQFRGTICKVEPRLALKTINADVSPQVAKTRNVILRLKKTIADMITQLYWKDFELLVDLIFTRAGWQRVRELGKTEKSVDLELDSPVLGEKAMVQVKSQSSRRELEKYWRDFCRMKGFSRFFYVVHTPNKNLKQLPKRTHLRVLLADDIAELSINSGLTEWILKKCS